MRNIKSRKITEVINKYGSTLNLHEIKALTGAGNGYNHTNTINSSLNKTNTIIENTDHKLQKITNLLISSTKNLNLHEIKSLTGAGSGYKY